MIQQLISSLYTDFLRHCRSPALLYVAIAAPIAAHYMVPTDNSVYSVLLVNGAAPVLTPSVLGLELGMITATILAPLAYIFLRAGVTRRRPWQITDVAPYNRPASAIGRWMADTGVLWIVLAALTLAGSVLMILRANGGIADFFPMAACLWLTTAPALGLVAAVRVLLGSRRLLRHWPGDVAFFLIWMVSLVLPIALGAAGETMDRVSPFADPYGFIYPVVQSTDTSISQLALGGGPLTEQTIMIDALGGTVNAPFIMSRLWFMVIAASIALFSGVIDRSHAPAHSAKKMRTQNIDPVGSGIQPAGAVVPSTSYATVKRARRATVPFAENLLSEISLLLSNRLFALALVAASIAGAVLSYRDIAGPLLFLVLIFPLSAQAARWDGGDLPRFLATSGTLLPARFAAFFIAGAGLGLLAHGPAMVGQMMQGEFSFMPQMLAISLGVPLLAGVTGYVTGGAVAGRLLLLIIWYGYLSTAG